MADNDIAWKETISGPVTSDGPLDKWSFDPRRRLNDAADAVQAFAPMPPRTADNFDRALATLDQGRVDAFLNRHAGRLDDFDRLGPVKYADFAFWTRRNVILAEWLDLDRSAPLDILDIGMGPGNFVMVANSMGHRAVGTDLSDAWYDGLCELAGAERVIAGVETGAPYRPVAREFDLITIMLPVFHRRSVKRKREYWPIAEWARFLDDLAGDMLKPGGRIFILMPLDKHDDGSLSYSPLLAWARSLGARLDRTAEGEPIRHVLFEDVMPGRFRG